MSVFKERCFLAIRRRNLWGKFTWSHCLCGRLKFNSLSSDVQSSSSNEEVFNDYDGRAVNLESKKVQSKVPLIRSGKRGLPRHKNWQLQQNNDINLNYDFRHNTTPTC